MSSRKKTSQSKIHHPKTRNLQKSVFCVERLGSQSKNIETPGPLLIPRATICLDEIYQNLQVVPHVQGQYTGYFSVLPSWQHRNTPAISSLFVDIIEMRASFSQIFSPRSFSDGFSGHFVALFRQPEQRLLSAWYDDEDLFRAQPIISRCAENRTVERWLTMEEFIEKCLALLRVFSNISICVCLIFGWSMLTWINGYG